MAGRTVVVTGGNSGVGFEAAKALAGRDASVTLAVRSVERGKVAVARIRSSVPGAAVAVAALDLASLASVHDFARRWAGPLDLLINNAGVMAVPRWTPSADGFELQFATNHLGHFALTGQLLPALLAAEQARVVTVSSIRHRSGTRAVLQGNPPADYRPASAYGQSKLANLLFALELQRRSSAHGTPVTSTAAHPGISATGLFGNRQGMGQNPLVRIGAPLMTRVLFQSASAGADPILYAGTEAEPGSYSGPRHLGETRGGVGSARISDVAQNAGLASELWDRSEELTETSYDWSARQ